MTARVLIIAGSDSGGGAGIQGDIKTVQALGGYSMTAITALTAQNTQGVFGIHPVPPEYVAAQMEAVLSDIGADAFKTGMLYSAGVIETVARVIAAKAGSVSLVVDPVMIAKGGAALLAPDALEALKTRLFPLASIITPNIPEAELLTSMTIDTVATMEEAALALHDRYGCAVLVKGGHLERPDVVDILIENSVVTYFTSLRIDTRHTHGTGCALASAIATGLAQGMSLNNSVIRARSYVHEAIRTAPGLGQGHGPLNHGYGAPSFSG